MPTFALAILTSLLLVPVASAADRITKETCASGGRTRTYYLYVPETPTPGAPAPRQPVCGPDVSTQVRAAVALLKSTWSGWNANQRDEACWALENWQCADAAWDIVQLHNRRWIDLDYTPACAGVTSNPGCEATVKIDGQCHFAGAVNYVIFGHMCRLCNIWQTTMRLMILGHKKLSSSRPASIDWALAGYADWPSTGTPPSDRPTCSPTCPTPYGPTANNAATSFDFHWYPSHTTETVSSDCDAALDDYRYLRDHPPLPDYSTFPF